MNKGQGFTAGAVVLGAALLRGGISPPATSPAEPSRAHTTSEVAKHDARKDGAVDGPWIASCNYWRPAGWTDPVAKSATGESKAEEVDVDSTSDALSWKLHVSSSRSAAECNAGAWGIPDPSPNPITAIIATVPDPVHSSLALDFDRNMDAIERAATDNGYLMSYYWLPWSVSAETGRPAPASAEEQHAAEDREKQPGIIILKPTDLAPDPDGSRRASSPGRVIYLFLVAQTPALGINGAQMQRALRYENDLVRDRHITLSVRDPEAGIDIVGPIYSGSAESVRTALLGAKFDQQRLRHFHVVGATSTRDAAAQLLPPARADGTTVQYTSFGEDANLDEEKIREFFCSDGQDCGRLAFLNESGTLYGSALSRPGRGRSSEPISIRFPREISLLRNAQREEKSSTDAASTDPYLHLSLKNTGSEDLIAHFSRDHMPVSQEAQWMALIRELKTRHVETVSISASNILDELFLTQLLHRDLPDARVVVFDTNDLLFTHVGDNGAYLGVIAETAYPIFGLPAAEANFASTWAEQFYNAVSFTLWDGRAAQLPHLSSYEYPSATERAAAEYRVRPPPLWVTVAGRDGFYPLGVVDACGSERVPSDLPVVRINGTAQGSPSATPEPCVQSDQRPEASLDRLFPQDHPSYPGFTWYTLCVAVTLLSLVHALLLRTASFWSPTTRDLAIDWSDEPRRRAVYLHISAAMLVSMGVVVAAPLFFAARLLHPSPFTSSIAIITLAAGVAAAALTLRKTHPYLRRTPRDERRPGPCGKSLTATESAPAGSRDRGGDLSDEQKNLFSEESLFSIFHGIALLAALVVCVAWCLLCSNVGSLGTGRFFLGPFFAYRCVYPASGVSPLLPVLLILLSWFIWSILQTKRLRFSANSRPMLPHRPAAGTPSGLYVPEEALSACSNAIHSCLFENVTCLLITRQLIRRVLQRPGSAINFVLAGGYSVLFTIFVFGFPIHGLDHFLRRSVLHLTLYEFLVSAIFYPLLVVALTGCVRMLVIWSSLRAGVLEPLERSPLRFAFSRLTNVAWMTMFKQNGVYEYWRDMTRSNHSLRQMIHCPELESAISSLDGARWHQAQTARVNLETHINALLAQIDATRPGHRRATDHVEAWNRHGDFLSGDDLPRGQHRAFLNLMCAIECDYVTFAEALLAGALIPYWSKHCAGLVESEPDAEEARDAGLAKGPRHIQLAEEFLALRYFSLIRSVLINLRQLMTFVSVSFVLALLAWNSYPFTPRQWIDWVFTALLFGLGAAVIWMFAQMHRNAILSRITGTQANELGSEFYLRLATFGAVPLLTWLASQFPGIGSTISRLLQSGSEFAK